MSMPDKEWANPQNWNGWFGTYVSPRDPRIIVPRRIPKIGWTLNFAHVLSWVCLMLILAIAGTAVAVVWPKLLG
jgi:uncharacterized membrane protein